jgi:ribosomal protein S18 acetylase RimI-like enzyme
MTAGMSEEEQGENQKQAQVEAQIASIVANLPLPPGLTIRAMTAADFPTIYALSEAEGWNSPRVSKAQTLESWHNSWPVLVLLYEENVIGFLRALTDHAITTYIADILVAPGWQRQGLGRALLEVCHQLTPQTHFVLMSVKEAVKFYEKDGFEHTIGFSKGFPTPN